MDFHQHKSVVGAAEQKRSAEWQTEAFSNYNRIEAAFFRVESGDDSRDRFNSS